MHACSTRPCIRPGCRYRPLAAAVAGLQVLSVAWDETLGGHAFTSVVADLLKVHLFVLVTTYVTHGVCVCMYTRSYMYVCV